ERSSENTGVIHVYTRKCMVPGSSRMYTEIVSNPQSLEMYIPENARHRDLAASYRATKYSAVSGNVYVPKCMVLRYSRNYTEIPIIPQSVAMYVRQNVLYPGLVANIREISSDPQSVLGMARDFVSVHALATQRTLGRRLVTRSKQ
ncbi:hypothetical protein SARC_04570, partial [Sphaeroforma arctica JP610]